MKVKLVSVEYCPIEGRVVARAAEILGREAAAERVLNVDEAVTGQRVFEELPTAVTVLRRVGFRCS